MSAMLSLGLLRTKFKLSLRSKDLQRFDPTKMGKEPPLPIIPERTKPPEEEEGKEKHIVKIEVSEGVTKSFPEFNGGTPKDLIKLVCRHELLINDMHCKMKTSVRWTYKNYTPDLTPSTGSVDRQYKSDLW